MAKYRPKEDVAKVKAMEFHRLVSECKSLGRQHRGGEDDFCQHPSRFERACVAVLENPFLRKSTSGTLSVETMLSIKNPNKILHQLM